MSSSKKNHSIFHTVSAKLGCCRRGNASAVFSPTPRRHEAHPRRQPHSSSSAATWDTTTVSTSSAAGTPPASYADDSGHRAAPGFGSVAVEKDSDDPYLDFRRSMLQMILEREIYSRDGLKELLNCFLQLNSPYYHGTIIRAFTEIWNGVPVDAAERPPENSDPPQQGGWVFGGY